VSQVASTERSPPTFWQGRTAHVADDIVDIVVVDDAGKLARLMSGVSGIGARFLNCDTLDFATDVQRLLAPTISRVKKRLNKIIVTGSLLVRQRFADIVRRQEDRRHA
jgi:hypothetical protein